MCKKKKMKKLVMMSLLTLILTLALGMTTMAASKTTVSLRNKKWYTDTSSSYNQTVYHKIKIPKTGFVTINGYGFSNYSNLKFSLSVKLCNSRKRELTQYGKNISSLNGYKTYFALKKGTYYIKVQGNLYKMKYSFKAMSDKSGTRRSSAKTVGKNKTVKGLVVMGEKPSKIDWYKIVLTKPQKLKFTYGALANDWVQFKMVSANPNISIIGASAYRDNTTETFSSKNAFPAGTYYIQVSRMNSSPDCSGYYTLRWR